MHTSPTRRWFTSLAALGGLAALATSVQSQTAPAADGRTGHGHSPEDMAKHLQRRIDHLIKAIDGTPEQKDKLLKLAQTAMADMQPLREQHMAARKKGLALLAAPSIDRAALEQLRGQQISLADTMSKRMLQHMADAAEVLTPVQRSKLAERMQKRGEGRGRWGHRGGHEGGMGGFMGGMGR